MTRFLLPALCLTLLLGGSLVRTLAQDRFREAKEDPKATWKAQAAELSRQIEARPGSLRLYSQRGDVRFFLGDFPGAVADYTKMVELDPETDTSHWRRGIAYFYAGDFKAAGEQFERYHSYDQVDRENGIWRYLSQRKGLGQEKAREGLLKYEKDDREPFPDVYRLFAGTIEPEAILKRIDDAQISDEEEEKRLFYAELYIGLNEAVEGRKESAIRHLKRAVANTWAEDAGYGPHYMWQVARLHLEQLRQAATTPEKQEP
ncbi:hypothetical protein [Planctomyces sp. SH-PL14]|uniref:hypothetical protein n=1 Tax=Planctomyces sp. SH-PL14 TaxID=1632864 RepID=UPI00078C7B3E|nr:hypothetical protein [Planctomyces sp. SH-PL14]AMV22527.1 Lipoprotein NlpI precursor [Planctomyces sp. SH-PL14]